MAMQLPADGDSDDAEPMIDMNTTPLIDVMLVLLVMLIITIPIQLHSVNMNVPVVAAPHTPKPPEKIELTIAASGDIEWQGAPVPLLELEKLMRGVAGLADQPVLQVRSDRHAKYSVLVSVLAASRRAGLSKIVLVGNEQYAN
jgi:biopolymer transport protein ExbD